MSVLVLNGARVGFGSERFIVDDVNLTLEPGEIVCLAGESGSGKTTTALAAFGHCAGGLRIDGQISIADVQLSERTAADRVRGQLISYVPQNPGTALNPAARIGAILKDVASGQSRERDTAPISGLLQRVELPGDAKFARRFPHQLSGGQQQRVCIAAALASNPKVVVLDEPTTGLDVVTQARILDELLRLRDEEDVAMLYITHDLAVAATIADRIVVMYGGYVVEEGPARTVLTSPKHPYTRGLMAATPDHRIFRAMETMPGAPVDIDSRPSGCPFAPRCKQRVEACERLLPPLTGLGANRQVRCPEWPRTDPIDWRAALSPPPPFERPSGATPILEVADLTAEHPARHATVRAVDDVSFSIAKGECVALVGESGSGKTTIARSVAGLHEHWTGSIRLAGEPLPSGFRKRSRDQLRRVQMVFQNPSDTLNPRYSVGVAIARPAILLRGMSSKEADAEVRRLLDAVHLPARFATRYPRELSGGQRQRVAIARALAAGPELLVCDEITSALDVSVQAVVLEVLRELREGAGLSLLFITHNLAVVATIADEVLVLNKGVICESGSTRAVLDSPRDEYTQRLLNAAPSLVDAIHTWSDVPAASERPQPTGGVFS